MTDKIGPLNISASMLADIDILLSVPLERLRKVVDAIRTINPPTIRSSVLTQQARAVLDNREADATIQLGLALSGLINRTSVTPEAALRSLEAGLERKQELHARVAQGTAHLQLLKSLVELDSMTLAAKAVELSYLHSHVFTSARLTTDIRPVFDRPKHEIHGAIISHTIHIDFIEDNRNKEISITLDEDDLENMIKVCREALEKSRASRRLINLNNDENIIIAGEEKYGAG